jgi:hypothetical protein
VFVGEVFSSLLLVVVLLGVGVGGGAGGVVDRDDASSSAKEKNQWPILLTDEARLSVLVFYVWYLLTYIEE